jgi:hypothetical protein
MGGSHPMPPDHYSNETLYRPLHHTYDTLSEWKQWHQSMTRCIVGLRVGALSEWKQRHQSTTRCIVGLWVTDRSCFLLSSNHHACTRLEVPLHPTDEVCGRRSSRVIKVGPAHHCLAFRWWNVPLSYKRETPWSEQRVVTHTHNRMLKVWWIISREYTNMLYGW